MCWNDVNMPIDDEPRPPHCTPMRQECGTPEKSAGTFPGDVHKFCLAPGTLKRLLEKIECCVAATRVHSTGIKRDEPTKRLYVVHVQTRYCS